MNSIDPSASEIGDLKIVSKVKSMFEVKPDNDVQPVRSKKINPEPVAAPVVETNGLVDGVEEKNEEVDESVVEENPVVVEKKPEPEPVVEEEPKPVVEEKPEPVAEEATADEKHVTFNEEKPPVINNEESESASKEETSPKTESQKDEGEPKETNQNQ